MRAHFARARDHGVRPVLWTDEWLGRNKLISNLSYLHKYRDHPVDAALASAIREVLARHDGVQHVDFVALNKPQILTSVYALLAQGRIHADLSRPKSEWVLRNEALENGDTIHGQDQLFSGTGLSP